MCPNNPIGTIDLLMVSHHGTDPSNSPQLIHALAPRVAVMQNGTRKGAGAQTMPTLRTSPGLEDIWQLHWGYGAGIEQNSAGVFIANVDDNQTIANALTAPPRGGGPGGGRGPGGGAPGAGAPPAVRRQLVRHLVRARRQPGCRAPEGRLPGCRKARRVGRRRVVLPVALAVAGAAAGRRRTRRRTGSRSWRSRTARSPCRTAATTTARRTARGTSPRGETRGDR